MKIVFRALTVLSVLGLTLAHWQFVPNLEPLQAQQPMLQSVSVEPLPLQVYCPGALVEVGGQSGVDLGSVERVGEARVSLNSTAQQMQQTPPVSIVAGAGAVAADSEQSTNLLSMVQAQAIDRERAVGLAATYCEKPTSSGWLINGFSTVGSETVLIAANPSEVEALVEIEIHLDSGVITDRFALAPGEQQLITTAQYANGEALFAIYFETSGPEISMAMQNRKTRGLNPIGVEVEGVQNPGTSFVFAGLRPLTSGFENPELRIYNPGDELAEVIFSVFTDDNVELYREIVPAGRFATLDLALDGEYQLATLTSDVEVLASIMNPSTQDVLDFAWLMPAELFTSMTLPLTSYQNTLLVANQGASALELKVESRTGTRTDFQSLVIAPFSQVAIPSSANSIRLDSATEFAVALEVFDPNGYSVIHPRENANIGNDLAIRVN
jgi:hypothetical protein